MELRRRHDELVKVILGVVLKAVGRLADEVAGAVEDGVVAHDGSQLRLTLLRPLGELGGGRGGRRRGSRKAASAEPVSKLGALVAQEVPRHVVDVGRLIDGDGLEAGRVEGRGAGPVAFGGAPEAVRL